MHFHSTLLLTPSLLYSAYDGDGSEDDEGAEEGGPTPGYSLDAAHPVPEPKGDEVLIRIDSVAICGSDIALYNWSEVAQALDSF